MTCSLETTVAQASRTMVEQSVGSIIVCGPSGCAAGIVTDRDLRGLLAAGRSSDDPVSAIMSSPLVTISPEAFVLEALLEMTRRDVHHLPVVEANRLLGVVSGRDLLLLQAVMPLELTRAIESRTSIPDLVALASRLTEMTRQLFAQGLSGYEIGRIVAEVSDVLVRRVLTLTVQELQATAGEPPVPFCWLALGSEGRREQTLKTDQDNALVYADPSPVVKAAAARYFGILSRRAVESLIQLGYPECPGGSMASNPQWCQPIAVWRGYFVDWTRDTTPQHLMYSSIYLDFRPVAGAPNLADELRDEIRAQVKAWRSFPRYLGKIAVSHAPPLGLFGRFTVRRENGRRGINVKLGAMLLLTNALRAYAIELGLAETNTLERLEAATRAGGCFSAREADDVREAYETIFHLRLRHQLARIAAGEPPDNLVDPYALSLGDQHRLRESLRAIRRLQGKVADRYFTEAI